MNLVRASDLGGRVVVSIATGEDVAEIRDVVYDGEAHRLTGFTLNKRGRLAGRLSAVLPARSVRAIGPDAVMIDDESSIDPDSQPAELEDLATARPVIGNRVISADGNDLGEVVGVILATGDDPSAVGYELQPRDRSTTSFVPISAQVALSGDNLILPAEAVGFLRDDLVGFGAAVASYRTPGSGGER